MATPKVVTDGTSGFEEAVLNKYLAVGDADHAQTKLWYGRLRYNGASWEVHASTDATGLSSGALAWNGGSSQLEITVTGFSAAPLVLATPMCADAALRPKAHASAATTVLLAWYDASGTRVTTQGTGMDACVVMLGA